MTKHPPFDSETATPATRIRWARRDITRAIDEIVSRAGTLTDEQRQICLNALTMPTRAESPNDAG